MGPKKATVGRPKKTSKNEIIAKNAEPNQSQLQNVEPKSANEQLKHNNFNYASFASSQIDSERVKQEEPKPKPTTSKKPGIYTRQLLNVSGKVPILDDNNNNTSESDLPSSIENFLQSAKRKNSMLRSDSNISISAVAQPSKKANSKVAFEEEKNSSHCYRRRIE